MNPSTSSGLKTKKSPHLGPLPKGEEVNESLIAINCKILQKLSTLEILLKRKDDKPLTFREACAYLGYAPSYLYKLTYRKVIPHYKPTGKMIFFSKNELDEWIYKSRCQNSEISSQNGSSTASSTSSELRLGVKNENEGSSTGSELQLTTKDPDQIEMELDVKSKNVKGETENVETEVLIEFPLKSRRGK